MGKAGGPVKVIATEQGAERLRERLARERRDAAGVLSEEFRADVLALLRSGGAGVAGHVEVDGRDAIRIESLDGMQVYLVDAATYDPVEWKSTGNGGGVTLRFPVYEELPVTTESMGLLDLQRPDIRMRASSAIRRPTSRPRPGSSRTASRAPEVREPLSRTAPS